VAEPITINKVPQTVDLVPINVNVALTGSPAGLLPVSCKIRNLGSSSAIATTVGFYISDDANLDGSDILLSSLAVDPINCCKTNSDIKTDVLVIPANTANGVYYILFKADNDDVIAESDEINNVKFKTVTISGAPLLPVVGKTNIEPSMVDNSFDLKQFPNPSQGQLFVEFTSIENSNETVGLQVYDQSGRLVLNTEFNNVEKGVKYELDLSELASGFYNVIYTSKDRVLSKKLILANN
jgi:hypothetical protein